MIRAGHTTAASEAGKGHALLERIALAAGHKGNGWPARTNRHRPCHIVKSTLPEAAAGNAGQRSGQHWLGVYGVAIAADFEMQHGLATVRFARAADDLALANLLAFADE